MPYTPCRTPQAVPRVLTLYCEHGSDQLARQAARVGGGGAQRSSRETKANNDVGVAVLCDPQP